MPLANCKDQLKLKCLNNCLLAVTGPDNANATFNNIVFTIKETKLYVPVVTLSTKDN